MKTTTVGKIADVQTGPFGSQLHKEDYVTNGTPIVTVEHLGQKIFTTQNLPCVSNKDKVRLAKYTMRLGDIIFSRVGSVDRCSFVTENNDGWLFSGRCLRLRVVDVDVNSEYLYYYFCQEAVKELIRNHAVGATMPSLNTKLLSELPFAYPEKEQQTKIVSLLSNIDAKIERNASINQNLKQQAQAIFKSWFVDFEPFQDGRFVDSELGPIPEGWRVGTLKDIAQIIMGQSPSGESYNDVGDGCVFFQGRAEFGNRFPTRRLFTTSPKRMAQVGDVLLSVRAPVGDLNLAYENCCIGRGLAALHSNNGCQAYLTFQMDMLRPQFELFNAQGTIFGCINKDALHSMKIILPPQHLQYRFEELVSPMEKHIRDNYTETCNLQVTRDTLLPKLMSGEIDVSEVEI